jgi:branched-subunit amino acid transport protein AzlD
MPSANLTTSIQPSSGFASSSVASSSEEYIQSTTTMPSANLTTSIQPSSGFASSSVASSSKEYPSPITTIISSVISTYPSRIISFSVVKNKKTSPTTVNKLPTIATEQKIMSYHISSYKTNLKSLPTTTLAGINNSIMKATNKTNNYIIYIVSSVAGFVIITAIVIIIYKYHSKQKQKERQKKLQLQRQKNTLKLKGIYEMDSDNSNEYLDDLDDLNEPYQLKSFQPQV